MLDLDEHSHRRLNPLTGEWVLVSPHRAKRPWLGQTERPAQQIPAKYDPTCYLCPGNQRANDKHNPNYKGVYVFDNDFAALRADMEAGEANIDDLLVARSERGFSRVICFTPDHSLALPRMGTSAIADVVDMWARQFVELGVHELIRHVQIFENRGEMMGASNPHPHCQIWATESIPNEPAKEILCQREYLEKCGRCLLCDYAKMEVARDERIVCSNDGFVAVVPFWAIYPYEVMIVPKSHVASIEQLGSERQAYFADILKRVTTRYDNLFATAFPYSMGLHQRPTDGFDHEYCHFHAHFYPPLLRSATVRKFLVGFEILGSPQRDITPESAAERLRALSESHYLDV